MINDEWLFAASAGRQKKVKTAIGTKDGGLYWSRPAFDACYSRLSVEGPRRPGTVRPCASVFEPCVWVSQISFHLWPMKGVSDCWPDRCHFRYDDVFRFPIRIEQSSDHTIVVVVISDSSFGLLQ